MERKQKMKTVELPEGEMCGYNCADGCRYWVYSDRDRNGRQYCSWYQTYYYPKERQGCLSFEK